MNAPTNPCTFPDCATHECSYCGTVRPHQDLMPVCDCTDLVAEDGSDDVTVAADPNAALIATAIMLGKTQIVADVITGRVPATVTDFASLHDYVDANEYGGLCDDRPDALYGALRGDPEQDMPDDLVVAANEVQGTLDGWIRDGGIRHALVNGWARS